MDLLGKALSDQAVTRQIEAASPTAEAEVGPDPSSSGPIVRIQVQDKSEASALEVRDLLVAMVPPRLAELQSAVGVDGRNRVTSSVLVVDADAEPVGRDKLVGAVVGGIVGLGLSLILLVLLDNVLLRREARRIRARDALDEDDSDEPGVESAPEDAVEDLPPDRRGSTPLESDSSLRRHHRSVGEDDLERSLADADVPQPAAAVSEQS
ncbi:hypothetical protein ASF40_00140 [Microbacterium sp. Leaf288]|nr:hypothetical protein ASF40_00140 [Microbacterium sp. Leaf288]